MYRNLRTIHLCTALFLLTFLAAYALSAVALAHRDWFAARQEVAKQQVTVDRTSVRAIAQELMERRLVRGELRGVTASEAVQKFTIARPGVSSSVVCRRRDCEITTTSFGWLRTLAGLHAVAGFRYQTTALTAWAVVALLVSLGLMLLGLTGLWMSLAHRHGRWVNAAVLVLPLPVLLYLIVSMRF